MELTSLFTHSREMPPNTDTHVCKTSVSIFTAIYSTQVQHNSTRISKSIALIYSCKKTLIDAV